MRGRKDQPQAQTSSTTVYRPHLPARTVLHKAVRNNLETYLAGHQDDDFAGGIPPYGEAAFHAYLKCGILAHGFARAYCAGCGHGFLIAFSCKGRDICPSCATRRMVETAAHLTDDVLPRVPFRQWVLSVPKRIRWQKQNGRLVLLSVISGLATSSPNWNSATRMPKTDPAAPTAYMMTSAAGSRRL